MSHDRPAIRPRSRAAWRAWLTDNHAIEQAVWVEFPKKASGHIGPVYPEIVEEALCFGWIDGTVRPMDEPGYTSIYVSRRRPGSIWARSNRERVEQLTRAGLMTPDGLAAVERAKADGSWRLLEDVEAHVVADDLVEAFTAHPGSREQFEAFAPSLQEQLLSWCYSAKRPATRATRITAVASAAQRGHSPVG